MTLFAPDESYSTNLRILEARQGHVRGVNEKSIKDKSSLSPINHSFSMEAKTRLLHGLFLSPFLLSLLPKQQIEKGIIKERRQPKPTVRQTNAVLSSLSFGMKETSSPTERCVC